MNPPPIVSSHLPSKTAFVFVFILALALYPSLASAHAKLVRSEPEANATLKQAPRVVELWFNEELEHNFCALTITDQSGNRVDKNNLSFPEGNKQLRIDLEDLGAGTFTIDWKVLSTDQHMMKGQLTFTVAPGAIAQTTRAPMPMPSAQEGQQPNPSMPQETSGTGSMQESGSGWALSFVRWWQYLAMMLLFGGFTFYLLVLRPALRRSRSLSDVERAIALSNGARRLNLLSWLSLGMLIITALVGLILQASTVFDKNFIESLRPSLLNQIITQTGFGAAWRLEVWAIAALLVIMFYISRSIKQEPVGHHWPLWWLGLITSAVMLLSQSWTGHAAAVAKEYRLAIPADWLHLVAGGFWVGGLFHLALTMPGTFKELSGRQRLHVLHRVIPLFTRLAIASTVLIVLTGVYNSWEHVESFGQLWSTTYGRTLSLKVLLMLPMLALGGLNTFILHPRASRLLKREEDSGPDLIKLGQSFTRSVAIEALLGVLVLLAAAVLVFLQPARQHPMTMTQAQSTGTRSFKAGDRPDEQMEGRVEQISRNVQVGQAPA